MTYTFGRRSTNHLLTVREDLRAVAIYVMKQQVYDFAIICGQRLKEEQERAFMLGNSKVHWPDSAHNTLPLSDALDFGPWCMLPNGLMGIPWDDTHAFAVLGGMFIAAGAALSTPIRYGGDWDMDGHTTDQILMDWGHVEIMKK